MLDRIVWDRTVYANKMDLALNNQQWLMCHKTKPNEIKLDHNSAVATENIG